MALFGHWRRFWRRLKTDSVVNDTAATRSRRAWRVRELWIETRLPYALADLDGGHG
jgi:hypothetical protein